MRNTLAAAVVFALLIGTTCLGDDPAASTAAIAARRVGPPPDDVVEQLQLDPCYRKYVGVHGFSIVACKNVPDAGLCEAAWLIEQMLADRPDILEMLAVNRVRFVVMNHDQWTTEVPEHGDLTPRDWWDRRARGLGATRRRPAVSCGVENLLGYPGDPYATENILIHEFGHAIHEMGLNSIDPTFDGRLKAAYEQALADGLWDGKYAATNKQEYWAEGVQSWFDTNRENDADHNAVNTRAELCEYDPRLADLLEEVFGDGAWRYSRPQTRRDLPHLKDWDFGASPRFQWPERLAKQHP